ncbi:alpha/beta hydrolase [Sulfitobacter sp. M57]|nr:MULTISPECIES: alpha/beta hydrolase [unclassified Sulfitobacter]MDF3463206.1 alpha/beta hydrolase [Sulfitobacter sp. Ks18]MDF3513762.1 alpha/beta hydrolase [Sulfitobacter sp. M36]MDF3415121.1 alpha/beta hydrolase [Sulfitobacter sp. KE5]MDF3422602.1 alpha/beta hydrolase [Sulfitobacter sp. KE43]MDF3433667.1 alpha/beta hydrolase [Sulfitobacter sp. KE42]
MFWRLADHDLDRWQSADFDFNNGEASVSGALWLPDGPPLAAVVIVHGDGAQDRLSGGGYAPFINTFLDRGIAVASWDKPGVGRSGGNWLHQSMANRVDETRAALRLLKQRFDAIPLGALGFSQAGWVLPQLSQEDADFLVLIGAAVSWQDQGDYYTSVRLAALGMDRAAIDETITAQRQTDDRIFGPNAQAEHAPAGMSTDRWHFIRRNRQADARPYLADLDLPLFAIWGADDLNVDAGRDSAIYTRALEARNTGSEITLWPKATHGLLKSSPYNWQLVEDWSWIAKARFVLEGRFAFAPGALKEITNWITEQKQQGRTAQ